MSKDTLNISGLRKMAKNMSSMHKMMSSSKMKASRLRVMMMAKKKGM